MIFYFSFSWNLFSITLQLTLSLYICVLPPFPHPLFPILLLAILISPPPPPLPFLLLPSPPLLPSSLSLSLSPLSLSPFSPLSLSLPFPSPLLPSLSRPPSLSHWLTLTHSIAFSLMFLLFKYNTENLSIWFGQLCNTWPMPSCIEQLHLSPHAIVFTITLITIEYYYTTPLTRQIGDVLRHPSHQYLHGQERSVLPLQRTPGFQGWHQRQCDLLKGQDSNRWHRQQQIRKW